MIEFNKDIQYRLESYLANMARMALNGYLNNPNTPADKIAEYTDASTKVRFIKSRHDEGDPQDFISNNSTCFNYLTYEVVISCSNDNKKYVGEVRVPYMMSNGSFIIDGKLRVATNNLEMDYDCSYLPDKKRFQFNGISFFINDNFVVASFMNNEGNHTVKLHSQVELESLGIDLNFTEDQLFKLYYLTDISYNEQASFPKKLTYNFLINLPKVKGINNRRDSVANVKISSICDSLITYLNDFGRGKGPKAEILKDLKHGLFYPGTDRKTGVEKDKYFAIGKVFTYTMRFFRQASKSGIDIATVVNPMVFDQLYRKIKLPAYLPYTMQFADIIDATNTPENGNVNIINELNVCIYNTDKDGIGIYCYEFPSGKKVGVKYNEYINSLVLRSEEWDYTKNRLKNSLKDTIRVKYHTYTIEIPSREGNNIKYIEPKIDDRFSMSSRTIPFLNSSDSVRVSMGCGMVKQAIELEHPEDPIIASGNTEIDSKDSMMNTYALNDGIVELKDGKLGIKYDSGIFQEFPESISGMNHVTITHKVLVNPGDRVTKGQKLTTGTTSDGSYKQGVNADLFYLNWVGMTYEDGVIISESMADKLAHWTLHDVSINIYTGDQIEYINRLGSIVHSTEELYRAVSNPITIEGKELDKTRSGRTDNILSKLTSIARVPNNITNGTIVAASYEVNPGLDKKIRANYESINKSVIDEFIDSINHPNNEARTNIDNVPYIYRNQRLGRTSTWGSQNKYGQSILGVIRFKIAVRRPAIIGDKLCNRYGSKGMVSCVIPDNCRPYYIDKKGIKHFANVIVNPSSIVARKNASQLHEALLSRCTDEIYNRVKSAKSDEELNKLLTLVKDIYGNQHKDLDLEGLKAMRDSGRTAFKIFVGTFTESAYDYVIRIADKLDVGEVEEVYVPSFSVHENKDYSPDASEVGLEMVSLEDEDGNLDLSKGFSDGTNYPVGWLDKPVVVGVNYYYKLYHSAVWSGSVTPTRENVKEPILGKGKTRRGGQALGEYEKWALQAGGASEIYQDPVRSPNYEINQYELVNAFLRGGIEIGN